MFYTDKFYTPISFAHSKRLQTAIFYTNKFLHKQTFTQKSLQVEALAHSICLHTTSIPTQLL